jgi:indoleamine 2,3-dioxygenase
MLSPPSTNLAEYAISIKNGFLPEEPPLQHLTNDYYLPWELVIGQLPQLLDSNTLRTTVDLLPVLSTSYFETEPEWRRAYLILSFFTHAYIWESGRPSDVSTDVLTFLDICLHISASATMYIYPYSQSSRPPISPPNGNLCGTQPLELCSPRS